MLPITRLLLLLVLTTFTVPISPTTLFAFDEPMLSIKTGNVTGVYYAAGSAVAKMHNRKLKEYKLRLITEASEGSISNIDDVTNGLSDFGIAQSNMLYLAREGEAYWENAPVNNLRSVLGLYTEALTLIAAVDASISSITDLKGKTLNIGELGSTDHIQALGVLKRLGLDPEEDLIITKKPTYEASELLQKGKIDAYFYTVGHPNLSIKEASYGDRKIMIVTPERELVGFFANGREDLIATDIPIDYYTRIANKEPIHTIGVKAILFSNADTDEEVVYHMVKEVFANFELFKKQHPAFAWLTPEQLTTGLIVPLHPGAERYFKEAGLLR